MAEILALVAQPSQDGVWRRWWRSRRGEWKSRAVLVRGSQGLDFRDAEWRPLAWWEPLPGGWEWLHEAQGGCHE